MNKRDSFRLRWSLGVVLVSFLVEFYPVSLAQMRGGSELVPSQSPAAPVTQVDHLEDSWPQIFEHVFSSQAQAQAQQAGCAEQKPKGTRCTKVAFLEQIFHSCGLREAPPGGAKKLCEGLEAALGATACSTLKGNKKAACECGVKHVHGITAPERSSFSAGFSDACLQYLLKSDCVPVENFEKSKRRVRRMTSFVQSLEKHLDEAPLSPKTQNKKNDVKKDEAEDEEEDEDHSSEPAHAGKSPHAAHHPSEGHGDSHGGSHEGGEHGDSHGGQDSSHPPGAHAAKAHAKPHDAAASSHGGRSHSKGHSTSGAEDGPKSSGSTGHASAKYSPSAKEGQLNHPSVNSSQRGKGKSSFAPHEGNSSWSPLSGDGQGHQGRFMSPGHSTGDSPSSKHPDEKAGNDARSAQHGKGEQAGRDEPSSHSSRPGGPQAGGAHESSSSSHGSEGGGGHGSSSGAGGSHSSDSAHEAGLNSHEAPEHGGGAAGADGADASHGEGGKAAGKSGPSSLAARSPNALKKPGNGGLDSEPELMTSQSVFLEHEPYTLLLNNNESLLCQSVAWGPHHDLLECKLREGDLREVAPTEVSAFKRGW